jgi:cytochrome oxidase Cu insertion factor (SCO1/SenC/PrrC family)
MMHAETLPWRASRQGRRVSSINLLARARGYFASDSARAFQTALGVIWLLDAGLQFQSFMYSSGFVQFIEGNATGQPHWLASTIGWGASLAQRDLTVFNTLFALIQVAIGLGLLYRRTVKPALAVSIAWALVVWWFGEGLGHLFASMAATSNPQTFASVASPLAGAPGPAVLYALIALLVWPNARPGGLLGVRGARVAWAVLWLAMAGLWLAPVNSSADATQNAIMMAPTGMSYPAGMAWLNRIQDSASDAASGHGLAIAITLAIVSAAIAVAVAANWRPRPFLALAILLNLGSWVVAQGFGGVFYTNSATDLGAGPLFVLLALVLYSLTPPRGQRVSGVALLAPLLAIAVAGVTATAIAQTPNVKPQPIAAPSPFDGLPISPPTPAPPVSLLNYRGEPVSLSQYQVRGQAVLLTFLDTHCPTVCLAAAAEFRRTLVVMPPSERRRLQIVAVSLDPGSDSAASVAAFLKHAGMTGRMQYLIGSPGQLAPIWTEWGVSGQHGRPRDRLDSSSIMYGIAATGQVMTRYSAYFTPRELVHDVGRLEAL